MASKVIKRDNSSEEYDREKIVNAILSANKDVSGSNRITIDEANKIAKRIELMFKSVSSLTVEFIQDTIEKELMKMDKYELAKQYIIYRYERERLRITRK